MTELRNLIAATIRRVDGNHTKGAAELADAIVDDLEVSGDLLAAVLADRFTDTQLRALYVGATRQGHRGNPHWDLLAAACAKASMSGMQREAS